MLESHFDQIDRSASGKWAVYIVFLWLASTEAKANLHSSFRQHSPTTPTKKKKGAENECQRERRTAGTTWYMYIYWRNRGPGPRKCILVYRGPSVLHPMPDTPSPFPVPPFPRYQFSRIQNALGPYLDTVQCTRDSPHV